MQYYIYKITNKINGKIYIGQHKVPLINENFRRYMGKGIAIRDAIKKYGKENFDKEILEYINDDEKHELVSAREKFWIKEYNCISPNGYNISPGGEGGCTKESARKGAKTRREHNYRHTEITKQKISIANKNKPKSKLHRKHLSEHHHLRTLHKILFESDNHIEETYDSIETIAFKHGIKTETILLRASEYGRFKNGILLLDLLVPELADRYKQLLYKRKLMHEGLFLDPIKKDIISYKTFKGRKNYYIHKNNNDYKNLNIFDCFLKFKE